MKPALLTIALLLSLGCLAQRDRPVSLRFTGQFDFGVRGMGTNDAGMGVGAALTVLAKKRVQLLTEARSDWYIGNKLLALDSEGRALPGGSGHTLQAGPQVFLTKTLALSATYGVAMARMFQRRYTVQDGYRLALTGYFGDRNNFVTQLSWNALPGTGVRHLGIGVGYRLR